MSLPLLEAIQAEYQYPPPAAVQDRASAEEVHYVVMKSLEEDAFDKLRLKPTMISALQTGQAELIKQSCSLGTIFVIRFLTGEGSAWNPPWKVWWRAVRLLATGPVRIIVLGHPSPRVFPDLGHPIDSPNINGGYTNRCDARSIVVYRLEESTRVLIHELLHASCTDPEVSQPEIEADVEAWTEIILCAMEAKGEPAKWLDLFTQQMRYSVRQINRAKRLHDVNTPEDYGWRYLNGKIAVWERMGFKVPTTTRLSGHSLRLTLCDPKN